MHWLYSEAPFKEKLKICWNYFQVERLIYKNTRDHKLNPQKKYGFVLFAADYNNLGDLRLAISIPALYHINIWCCETIFAFQRILRRTDGVLQQRMQFGRNVFWSEDCGQDVLQRKSEQVWRDTSWCMMDALDENRWNVLLVGINYDKKTKEKDKRASVHDREVWKKRRNRNTVTLQKVSL